MADEAAWAYARAIVDLAVRRETLDEVEDGVRALAAALRTDPELHRYLLSPIAGRRARAADARLDAVLPPDLVDALGVIMAHSRQAWLPDILAAVADLADAARGRVRVQVTTASALETGARARLAEELARHMRAEVVLDSRVDPAIVGGMIIRCGDKVVDGSVKERLAVLKRRLMAQPVGSDYCHENQS